MSKGREEQGDLRAAVRICAHPPTEREASMAQSAYDAVFVFAGAYSSEDDARADFGSFKELHNMDFIGKYQAAIFEKTADGKVKVLDTTSTTRATGAKWGTAVGAIFGVIFPPSLIVSAAVGAGAGAIIGNLSKGWFSGDIKEMAEGLEPGWTGVILVAEATPDLGVEKLLKKAQKADKKEITGDDKVEVAKALDSDEVDE
jgi:uncharacterized membrane protein